MSSLALKGPVTLSSHRLDTSRNRFLIRTKAVNIVMILVGICRVNYNTYIGVISYD